MDQAGLRVYRFLLYRVSHVDRSAWILVDETLK